MGLPEGVCFKCKEPIFVETGRMRPLCTKCEKEFNEKIQAGMAARGKNVKGKCLVFPKEQERPDDAA
jgi:hypothetical protein